MYICFELFFAPKVTRLLSELSKIELLVDENPGHLNGVKDFLKSPIEFFKKVQVAKSYDIDR